MLKECGGLVLLVMHSTPLSEWLQDAHGFLEIPDEVAVDPDTAVAMASKGGPASPAPSTTSASTGAAAGGVWTGGHAMAAH